MGQEFPARQGQISTEGQVDKVQGGGFYAVVLPGGVRILATLSGRLRNNHIRVLPGDRVRVEVSQADPTKGFIVYRNG